ncbi:MAG: hypothetical protein ACOCP8_05460 [archaeon]
MYKEFWLGLIGGIFGIIGALAAITVGSAGEVITGSSSGLYLQGSVALLFSIVGIAIPAVMDTRKWIGAIMIASGIIVLMMISMFGVLPMVLFVIGGIIAIKNRDSEESQNRSLK